MGIFPKLSSAALVSLFLPKSRYHMVIFSKLSSVTLDIPGTPDKTNNDGLNSYLGSKNRVHKLQQDNNNNINALTSYRPYGFACCAIGKKVGSLQILKQIGQADINDIQTA